MNKMSKATSTSKTIETYVDGARVPTSTVRGQDIFNPATGEVTAHVGYSNASDVADEVVEKSGSRANTLLNGSGMTPASEVGPIVSDAADDGFFLGASLLDHVTPDMTIYKEEVFGPVLACVRVNDFEDALHLIKSHEFRNGESCYTQDGNVARELDRRVEAGINVPIPVPMTRHGVAGWKKKRAWRHARLQPSGRAVLHQTKIHHAALACQHLQGC